MEAFIPLIKELIVALAGPAGGLVLAVIILVGVFYIAIKHVFPAHKEQIQTLITSFDKANAAQAEAYKALSNEHREDRAAFKEGLKEISDEVSKMSHTLENQNVKIEKLHRAVVERNSTTPNYGDSEMNLI